MVLCETSHCLTATHLLEAIKLSDEIGLKKAVAQPGLPYYTLADLRNKSKHKIPLVEQLNETDTDRRI